MDSKLDGLWVVVYGQGKSFIGKVKEVIGPDPDVTYTVCKADILDTMRVALCPAYDFFSPIRPVQQDGRAMYTRDPVVTPFDFATDDLTVYTTISSLAFFDDMTTDDRETYEMFVQGAETAKEAQRKARSAQKSGIILPEKGGIARLPLRK